ncbi:hypothetical protein V5O48_008553 [Marasmius crinis-equi]|uniref:Uncharacterized protein n=1 Tax=Marasmius crinis-equi TaxID=585013 RepID=A0ABR3FDL4_9AGAR
MYVPLPDERPRASVANLIGRFEQQVKKNPQSSNPIVIPGRSTSVASDITGDSAKEAIKERREWPPKAVSSSAEPPAPIKATPFSTKPGPFVAPEPPSSENKPDAPVAREPSPPASSPPIAEPSEPAVKAEDPQKKKGEESAAAGEQPHAPEKAPKAQTTKGAKSAPPSAFRTPTKAPVKATPRSVSNASSTPALRPQHTGPSATSTSSTRKSVTPRTAPNTPSRPKTSSGTPSSSLRARTPVSSSRSKTPTPSKTPAAATVPLRSKTPSNLFAPTAASLARSRNASAETNTPARKATLSSSAADRLSKPTASSLSKSRSPPPSTMSPPRGSPSARGAKTAQRGAKPKVATPAKSGAKKGVPGETNGHGVGATSPVSDAPHSDDARGLHDEPLEHEAGADVNEHEHEGQEVDSHHVADESALAASSPEPQHAPDSPAEEETEDRSATPTKHEALSEGLEEENGVESKVGTDIEDMVSLLEQAKARPISIVSIPDDVNDIPDED